MSATHGDPWRWTCPNGHRSWVSRSTNPRSRRYYCEACGASFPELADAKAFSSDA